MVEPIAPGPRPMAQESADYPVSSESSRMRVSGLRPLIAREAGGQ